MECRQDYKQENVETERRKDSEKEGRQQNESDQRKGEKVKERMNHKLNESKQIRTQTRSIRCRPNWVDKSALAEFGGTGLQEQQQQ